MAQSSPFPGDPHRSSRSLPSRHRRGFTSWHPRSDADIADSLRVAFAERPDVDAIDFVVADGVVNLTGQLEVLRDTETARRTAISVVGVRRVNDWLTSEDEVPFAEL